MSDNNRIPNNDEHIPKEVLPSLIGERVTLSDDDSLGDKLSFEAQRVIIPTRDQAAKIVDDDVMKIPFGNEAAMLVENKVVLSLPDDLFPDT